MPEYVVLCECGEKESVFMSVRQREEAEKNGTFYPTCKCGKKMNKTSLKDNTFRMRIKHEI